MSKECIFCGKKPQVGNLVSHSNIKTKRRFNPKMCIRDSFSAARSQAERCANPSPQVRPFERLPLRL